MTLFSRFRRPRRLAAELGFFNTYLSLWIVAAILAGLALGSLVPAAFAWIRVFDLGGVNLAIAALVWLMIFPTMVKVDYSQLAEGSGWSKGLVVSAATTWLIAPFTMAVLATYFLTVAFAAWIPPADAGGYVAGLILLGAAPCTGMVLVWSRLTRGDATFTVIQVAINDVILVLAFAPLVAILLGVANVEIPARTLLVSTIVFVVLPLVAGAAVRRRLLTRGGDDAVRRFTTPFEPLTSGGLIVLVMILFALQAEQVLMRPFTVLLIAVPLIIQAYAMFALAYLWAWAWRLRASIAAPTALIATSSFFELAIAVAIGLFGFDSPAALATVVGVLVEVPVMLSLVAIANRSRSWIDARATAIA